MHPRSVACQKNFTPNHGLTPINGSNSLMGCETEKIHLFLGVECFMLCPGGFFFLLTGYSSAFRGVSILICRSGLITVCVVWEIALTFRATCSNSDSPIVPREASAAPEVSCGTMCVNPFPSGSDGFFCYDACAKFLPVTRITASCPFLCNLQLK